MRSPVELIRLVLVLGGITWTAAEGSVRAADTPEVPRIDSVVMSAPQPQASDEAVTRCREIHAGCHSHQ